MNLVSRVKICLACGLLALVTTTSFATQPVWTIEDVLESASQLSSDIQNQVNAEPEVTAHVLASLSMPKASLDRLAEDAKLAGIILSFRGVPLGKSSNSTYETRTPLLNAATLAPFKDLIDKGVEVELNPELFTEHGVIEVPALVLKENTSPSASGNCNQTGKTVMVTGDVTLGFALDKLTDRNDLIGEKARELRGKLEGRQ